MTGKKTPRFGLALEAQDAVELLLQKLSVHESVITAAVFLLDASVGHEHCLCSGLQYSFEELKDVAMQALEESVRVEHCPDLEGLR